MEREKGNGRCNDVLRKERKKEEGRNEENDMLWKEGKKWKGERCIVERVKEGGRKERRK